jgi:predicted protein tyrosine phosphatase
MQQVYWVEEQFLGGRCGPDCVPWSPPELYKGGVQAIVSLDPNGVEEAALADAGIIHLPLYQPMILLETAVERKSFLEIVPQVLDFIKKMERRKTPVIVHCHYGRDRTGAVLSCCLQARLGLSAREAIERVRQMQPDAMLAPGYQEVVELYESMR